MYTKFQVHSYGFVKYAKKKIWLSKKKKEIKANIEGLYIKGFCQNLDCEVPKVAGSYIENCMLPRKDHGTTHD